MTANAEDVSDISLACRLIGPISASADNWRPWN